jgi:AcrR family transcriptional regulator
MASEITRQKILDAACVCFNREGLANVRLQQMADAAGMSLGNMTYHFRNKEAIVQALWRQIETEQRQLLDEFKVLPLFEDIDRLLEHSFALQQQYRFFYLDTLEVLRAHPDIEAPCRQHWQWQIQQLEMAIRFNQSRGAFRSPESADDNQRLARQFWQNMEMWWYSRAILPTEKQDFAAYRNDNWAVFWPYFTNMGQREFEQLEKGVSFFP